MRQLLQDLNHGETLLAEVPARRCAPGSLLIRTAASLVSLGTERMLLDFAQAGWLQKARLQPDKIRPVLAKLQTDGFLPTLQAIRARLDQPLPLGYSNVGTIIELGPGVPLADFELGDRVVSNGPHAESVCVPRNLCARVPEPITNDEAAFTVVGAIALQGIRLAQPALGEKFVVIGLGLIGLMAVQLLRANGCEVLGIDVNPDRLGLAESFGAAVVDSKSTADTAAAAQAWSRGVGADGVIIAASADTNEVIHEAAQACRKRGRIVLVGVVGLDLKRDDFYKKELTFQVSCSYGPGRYDPAYEQGGQDYPLPFVRWSAQRNFEAVLGAMKNGSLNVRPLISHRFNIADALAAYETIKTDSHALGILLEYPGPCSSSSKIPVLSGTKGGPNLAKQAGNPLPAVGVIGAGNYARSIFLPALAATPVRLCCIADHSPASAAHAAGKFHFESAASEHRAILDDPSVGVVFILTRHDSHASLVCEALAAGKHVFVEKPLCLSPSELVEIGAAYARAVAARRQFPPLLMVGFNRRFSAHTRRIKELLSRRIEPVCMNVTVNSGQVAPDHWLHDPGRGGGRIVGESCHFVDLLACLAASPIARVSAVFAGNGVTPCADRAAIQLRFADGSIGTINYFANGARSYPKESLEIFSDGRVLHNDNFRVTRGYGFKHFRRLRTWRQDKGHRHELACFIQRITAGGSPLIPFSELDNVTRATFAILESAATGETVRL